jgi:hypothetical protein
MMTINVPLIPPAGTLLYLGPDREQPFFIKEDMCDSIVERVKDLKQHIAIDDNEDILYVDILYESTPPVSGKGYVITLSIGAKGEIWATCVINESLVDKYLTPILTYRAKDDMDIGGWQLTGIFATDYPAIGWPYEKVERYMS